MLIVAIKIGMKPPAIVSRGPHRSSAPYSRRVVEKKRFHASRFKNILPQAKKLNGDPPVRSADSIVAEIA